MERLSVHRRCLTYQGLDVGIAGRCCSRDGGNCAKYISYLVKSQLALDLSPEILRNLLQGNRNV